MEFFEGGWTRFGRNAMSSEWNYVNEHERTVTIEVISDTDIQKMQLITFTEFKVITDVQFGLTQDDSFNPSWLDVTFLPLLTHDTMRLTGDRLVDYTHLTWSEGKKGYYYYLS